MNTPPICLCGCGSELRTKDGVRLLVCLEFWHGLPGTLRRAYSHGAPPDSRAAARRILKAAAQWRAAQGGRHV